MQAWVRKPIIHHPASFPQRLNTVDLISNDAYHSVTYSGLNPLLGARTLSDHLQTQLAARYSQVWYFLFRPPTTFLTLTPVASYPHQTVDEGGVVVLQRSH